MSIKIILLPAAFISIWIFIDSSDRSNDWRLNFLLSLIGANIYLVLITEIVSLFDLLNHIMVSILWFVPVLFLIILCINPATRKRIKFPQVNFTNWSWFEKALLFLIVLVLLITGFSALIAPPNTPDVLNYHMPRVMHWIQNKSVHHYPTGIEIQNSYPPAAEFQVLHLLILADSDRFVNFASWFTLLASVICVSYLTSFFGVDKQGQLLSSLFVVTLPIAILQASSAKNDLHVAFWTLLTFTLVMAYFYLRQSWVILISIFCTIGLGALTKANTVIYLIPILIWFSIVFIKHKGIIKALQWGFVALTVVSILNGGYLIRNLKTYGSITYSHQTARMLNAWMTPRGIFSNLIRNTSFHLQYPWSKIRQMIQLLILKIHAKLGMNINDPRTTSDGYFSVMNVTTSESLTGNTLHAFMICILIIIDVINLIRQKRGGRYWTPLVFAFSGFALFSILMKWQVFGARYFLPVFFIVAPIFGIVLSRLKAKGILLSLALFIVILSWPWLFAAENRPIISQSRYAEYPSILSTKRMVLLLGSDQQGFPGLFQLPELVNQTNCKSIGIYGGGITTEYQIWAVLNTPREDIRLEWIVAGNPSAAYIDPFFEPCLIVCHLCPDNQVEIKGLSRVIDGRVYAIYRQDSEYDN